MIATQTPVVSAGVSTKVPSTSLPTIAELDRALERPIQRVWDHDLEVLASHRRPDGAKVYTVSSYSRPGHVHGVVKRRGSMELTCDCEAYQYGRRPCSHQVAVWQAMVVESALREVAVRKIGARLAAEIRPTAQASAPERPAPSDAGDELLRSVMDPQDYADLMARAAATPAPTRESPALATDTRAVGIWK